MSTSTTHTCDAPGCDQTKPEGSQRWLEATIYDARHLMENVDGCCADHLIAAIAAVLGRSWREAAPTLPPPPDQPRVSSAPASVKR